MTIKKTVRATREYQPNCTIRLSNKRILTSSAGKGVDQETTNKSTNEPNNSSNGDGCSGLAKRDTSHEHYSFHSCATQTGG